MTPLNRKERFQNGGPKLIPYRLYENSLDSVSQMSDVIFVLRQLEEKFGAKKKELFIVLVDLEKAFDYVPSEAILWALRR